MQAAPGQRKMQQKKPNPNLEHLLQGIRRPLVDGLCVGCDHHALDLESGLPDVEQVAQDNVEGTAVLPDRPATRRAHDDLYLGRSSHSHPPSLLLLGLGELGWPI